MYFNFISLSYIQIPNEIPQSFCYLSSNEGMELEGILKAFWTADSPDFIIIIIIIDWRCVQTQHLLLSVVQTMESEI